MFLVPRAAPFPSCSHGDGGRELGSGWEDLRLPIISWRSSPGSAIPFPTRVRFLRLPPSMQLFVSAACRHLTPEKQMPMHQEKGRRRKKSERRVRGHEIVSHYYAIFWLSGDAASLRTVLCTRTSPFATSALTGELASRLKLAMMSTDDPLLTSAHVKFNGVLMVVCRLSLTAFPL